VRIRSRSPRKRQPEAEPPNSNTFRTNASGAVIGYANKFAYLDAILKLDLDTNPRFPTTLLFNFVNNVRGSRERSGYWAEATVGRTRKPETYSSDTLSSGLKRMPSSGLRTRAICVLQPMFSIIA